LVERHAFGLGLPPADLDAASVVRRDVAERLRRVEAASAMAGQVALLGTKRVPSNVPMA
jgi:hypothetical protein